jgi:hypothetical protein
MKNSLFIKNCRDIPGSPVFKNQHFHCWGKRFDRWSGTRILHAIYNRQENLEDNTGAKLEFGNEILGTTPKAQSMKENNKLNLVNIKNFYLQNILIRE